MKKRIRETYVIFLYTKGSSHQPRELKAKLVQTKVFKEGDILTLEDVKMMLDKRFDGIDLEKAKGDVKDFANDKAVLNVCSSDFFKAITAELKTI